MTKDIDWVWISIIAAAMALTLATFIFFEGSAGAENSITTKRFSFHPARGSVGTVEKGHFRTAQNGADVNWTCWANDSGEGELIPYNSLVTWHCPAPGGVVCLSQTINGADIALNTTTGVITDSGTTAGSGNDGAGSCFYCTGYFAQVLSAQTFFDPEAVLRRTGVCQITATSAFTGAPCRATTECDTGQTCETTTDHLNSGDITGAYTCWADGVVSYVTAE